MRHIGEWSLRRRYRSRDDADGGPPGGESEVDKDEDEHAHVGEGGEGEEEPEAQDGELDDSLWTRRTRSGGAKFFAPATLALEIGDPQSSSSFLKVAQNMRLKSSPRFL